LSTIGGARRVFLVVWRDGEGFVRLGGTWNPNLWLPNFF
jgi:RES domain-containing protein